MVRSPHSSSNGHEFSRRLCALTTLHAIFIASLFCSGLVGLGIFSFIVAQPIRWCPKLNTIFITYWLGLGLCILQVILAVFSLTWLLVVVLRVNKSFATLFHNSNAYRSTDHSASQCRSSSTNSNTSSGRRHRHSASSSQTIDCSPSVMGVRHARAGRTVSPSSSLAADVKFLNCGEISRWRCKPCSSKRRNWWLGLAGVLFAVLIAGLIICIVFTVNHWNYVTKGALATDLTSIFIEAKQSTQSSRRSANNALRCWNHLQKFMRCCGVWNYTDWKIVPPGSANRTYRPELSLYLYVPDTCYCDGQHCPTDVKHLVTVTNHKVYAVGCRQSVIQLFESQLFSVKAYLIAALTIILFTFLADVIYTLLTAQATLKYLRFLQQGQQCSLDALTNHAAVGSNDVVGE